MNIFHEETSTDGNQTYKLYTADVWAVSLGREVRVVIVDYFDTDKKRQTRKVFFCTNPTKSAKDIFDIYRTRFQLEFVYREGKQFTGLTHCQARNKAISFAFNAAMLERFNSMSAKHANRRLNNTDFKELLFYGVRTAV